MYVHYIPTSTYFILLNESKKKQYSSSDELMSIDTIIS